MPDNTIKFQHVAAVHLYNVERFSWALFIDSGYNGTVGSFKGRETNAQLVPISVSNSLIMRSLPAIASLSAFKIIVPNATTPMDAFRHLPSCANTLAMTHQIAGITIHRGSCVDYSFGVHQRTLEHPSYARLKNQAPGGLAPPCCCWAAIDWYHSAKYA